MHPWFVVNNSRYSPSTFPCQHTCPPSKSSKNKNCTGKWWNSTHIAAPYTTPVPIPKDNVLPSSLLHAKLSCKKAYVTDLKWRLASTSQLQVHLWWPSSTRIPTLGTVKGETIWIVCALCFPVSFRSCQRLHKISEDEAPCGSCQFLFMSYGTLMTHRVDGCVPDFLGLHFVA